MDDTNENLKIQEKEAEYFRRALGEFHLVFDKGSKSERAIKFWNYFISLREDYIKFLEEL